ncbi:MAG: competence/damage-inducible protein A [Endomicrobiia bacterium]
MHIEIIGVGTELLLDKVNTNILYIGEKLNSIGLEINRGITVPDNLKEMIDVFSESFNRSDIVIITGGLGPTFDDLTREAVSKVLNKKLKFNKEIMQSIARHFAERDLEMPKGNERQAYIIDGAEYILNKIGTAPGQIIKQKKQKKEILIFLLPGPLRELQPMFESKVLPYIKEKFEQKIVKTKTIHVFGLPESKVNEIILPIVETERKIEGGSVDFTILCHPTMVIDIKITVKGLDELLADETINNIKGEIYSVLKENIYGEDSQTLESVVGELLIKNKKTLSVAESCTGGLISNKITNIPGSSVYFLEGIVAYSNRAKIEILGVSEETINKFGAVSEETAIEMAKGVKKISGSDISCAVTGIAGPTGQTPSKPIGTVCFAIVTPLDEISKKVNFTGNRLEIKERSANFALDLLRRKLLV